MKFFAFSLWFLLASGAAIAQGSLDGLTEGVASRKAALVELETQLSAADTSELIQIRTQVRAIRAATTAGLPGLTESRDNLRTQLQALGELPAEGQPPESEEIASERARLTAALGAAQTLLAQSELNLTNATSLLNDIAEERRGKFYDQVFVRQQSPVRPATLETGLAGFISGVSQSETWVGTEIQKRRSAGSLTRDIAILLGAFALAFVFIVPIRRRLNARVTDFMSEPEPSQGRLVIAALFRALARAMPAILGGFVVFVAVRSIGLVAVAANGETGLAGVIWVAFVAVFALDGIIVAVTNSRNPTWRLLPLSRASTAALRGAGLAVVGLMAADAILRAGAPLFNAPQETIVLQSAAAAVGLMILLAILGRATVWCKPSDISETRDTWLTGRWRSVPSITLFLALAVIGAVLAGYVPLGYFAATRIFYLLALVGLFICARAILRETLRVVVERFAETPIEDQADDEESALMFWLGFILDAALALLTLIPAVLVLGADWIDVRDAVTDAFFGFTIGNVTISIAGILAAIATFMAILWATRVIQVTADTKIFPKTKMDVGVRNSFRTLIGYAGFTVAVLAAIGVVGADLSSLAIVAGALSVGIGFGLQSVVSNFVSGLILLFERPIKVGDWIVTSSGQGFVRRISVRSTEIETFDRSSIIVPNSELIANSVTNMTLGNKLGRIILPVGVSYDSDPETIMAILLELTAAHPKILKTPEPSVIFSGMGDSSLDFEIRGFIRDIGGGVGVSSELRVAIFKRLKAENIDIPFPQRVIHQV
ncbi:mechanosensitive ion channel [Rhodobacteraceae bacterium]|nr:mechanosensitive ion channel [Paracoccaceae bacterium]